MQRHWLPLIVTLPVLLGAWACASLGRGASSPRTGTWNVRGDDGVHWDATLVLLNDSNGHFDWLSSDGARGREPVHWEFEPDTRRIHLQGTEILDPIGNIAFGTYQAEVSEDGLHMRQGWWGGDNNAEGSWTADWRSGETGE